MSLQLKQYLELKINIVCEAPNTNGQCHKKQNDMYVSVIQNYEVHSVADYSPCSKYTQCGVALQRPVLKTWQIWSRYRRGRPMNLERKSGQDLQILGQDS